MQKYEQKKTMISNTYFLIPILVAGRLAPSPMASESGDNGGEAVVLAESESKFMLKLFEGGKITKLGSQAAG
jgi:hypothetical protein